MCAKCDNTLPDKYIRNKPHIKAICSKCGFYHKFISATQIPNYKDSKALIFEITTDLKVIEEEKAKMPDFSQLTLELSKNIAYHNLYVNILKRFF